MTPEDTPLKLLSNGYILTPPEAPWSVDDRKWFAHNPVRSHRLRPLFPQEAEQSGWTDLSKKRGPDLRVTKLSKEQRHNLRVIVRQLEPGARIRHVFYLNSALPDPSNVKSLCHALFDGVASGHLPPSRQIAAQAMAYEAAKNGARS